MDLLASICYNNIKMPRKDIDYMAKKNTKHGFTLLLSLKQELERLSPRELMIIRTYFDYPIEVVARKLKVRPNTISKARRKIARELRKKLV